MLTAAFGCCLITALVLLDAGRGDGSEAPSAAGGGDLLARSRARYGALRSYADTGVVEDKWGPAAGNVYRHTFKTYYRAPRNFYFEFNADQRAGGARMVIWCDGGDFQSWSSTTERHDTYPRGTGAATSAFSQMAYPTRGAVALIPALLFAGSGLVGTVNEFGDASAAGDEAVGGRQCRKLLGVARSTYPATQRVTNVRRATLWIDDETALVRRVWEDTPRGLPSSAVIRITTTLEPQVNPGLADSVFQFAVPSLQK
jgi:hypothetical protein